MKVSIFRVFGREMPIHAPKIVVFGRFDPNKWNHQKAHPCMETCRVTYRLLKSIHWCDLCAWLRNQIKEKRQRTQTVANHHVIVIEIVVHGGNARRQLVLLTSSSINIGSLVTEMWEVKIWVIALLRPMSYTAMYYVSHRGYFNMQPQVFWSLTIFQQA